MILSTTMPLIKRCYVELAVFCLRLDELRASMPLDRNYHSVLMDFFCVKPAAGSYMVSIAIGRSLLCLLAQHKG